MRLQRTLESVTHLVLVLLAGIGIGSLLGGPRTAEAGPGLAARVAALEKAVAKLQNTVNSQGSQITGLQNTVQALQSTVSTHGTQISDLKIRAGTLETGLASLQSTASTLQTGLNDLKVNDVNPLKLKLARVSVSADGNDIFITGANLNLRNGMNKTESLNGLGNLVIGYNESRAPDGGRDDRSGSHNLVVGRGHNFSGFGGMVAGLLNAVGGRYAAVTGGTRNIASGDFSHVAGGSVNESGGASSAVLGGTRCSVAPGAPNGTIIGGEDVVTPVSSEIHGSARLFRLD